MGKPLRVLIVEDSEDDLLLLLRELKHCGYEVRSERVETADAMQSALTRKTWDLILSDFTLPEFNAPQALEVLKASGLDLPFIIISGTIGEDTAVTALKAGANDFLVKGKFARLGPTIERELREAEIRRGQRWLADQLKYHARLLRYISDAVIATDDQLRITAWNRAAERMYGWSSEEVVGRNISEILSVELTDEQRVEGRESLKESFASRGERVYHCKDGRTVYVETNAIALTDIHGTMTGFVSVDRDITEHKRAVEKLQESEERFRQAVMHAPVPMMVHAEDGELLVLNNAWLNLSGYARFEIPNMATWVELAYGERQVSVQAAIQQLYDLKQPFDEGENVIHTRLGEQLTWEFHSAPLGRLPDGRRLVISMANDVTRRKQTENSIKTQLERLTAVREIDSAINSTSNLQISLSILLSRTLSLLGIDAGDILLINPAMNLLEYAEGKGFRTKIIEDAQVRLGEGLAGRVAVTGETVAISDLNLAQLDPLFKSLVQEEGFVEYVGVPLISKGKVLGVLEAYQRNAVRRDPDWLDFLKSLAGQASIAIDNAQSFDGMNRLNMELVVAYDATIEGWSRAMDLRDKETEGHTQRVTEMTLKLAERMDLRMQEQAQMRWGALLHDIGKLGVPDSILLKPGKLTDDEREIMKRHPALARDMLSSIVYLRRAIDIPYSHHEKWDGTGYPEGLAGEQIPLPARIFAVVDVWDALTSDRPYRSAWSREKALEYIREQSGSQFDPRVVEAFLEMIKEI